MSKTQFFPSDPAAFSTMLKVFAFVSFQLGFIASQGTGNKWYIGMGVVGVGVWFGLASIWEILVPRIRQYKGKLPEPGKKPHHLFALVFSVFFIVVGISMLLSTGPVTLCSGTRSSCSWWVRETNNHLPLPLRRPTAPVYKAY